jgi:hypothetical protein
MSVPKSATSRLLIEDKLQEQTNMRFRSDGWQRVRDDFHHNFDPTTSQLPAGPSIEVVVVGYGLPALLGAAFRCTSGSDVHRASAQSWVGGRLMSALPVGLIRTIGRGNEPEGLKRRGRN